MVVKIGPEDILSLSLGWVCAQGCREMPTNLVLFLCVCTTDCFSFVPERKGWTCLLGVIKRSFAWVSLSGCFLFLLDRGKIIIVFSYFVFVFLVTRWLWWGDIASVILRHLNVRQVISTAFYRFPSPQEARLLAPGPTGNLPVGKDQSSVFKWLPGGNRN